MNFKIQQIYFDIMNAFLLELHEQVKSRKAQSLLTEKYISIDGLFYRAYFAYRIQVKF